MYSRYRPCPPTAVQKTSIPYCPPVVGSGPGAIAESAHLAQKVASCGSAWVQTIPGPRLCGVSEPTGGVIRVAVPPAGPLPVVEVGTVPASLTTQQAATATLFDATNPYNPATRFAQYFPPPPVPAPCPFRMPNNDPKPSTRDCIPIRRFMGSAQEAAMLSSTPTPTVFSAPPEEAPPVSESS